MPTIITVYKYRIYCTTETNWVYLYDTVAPTVCPTSGGHSVNSNSVTLIDQFDVTNIINTDSPYSIKQNSAFCDTTSGAIVINLPKTARCPDTVYLFKKTAAANTVTLTPNGSELIDGSATKVLSVLNETALIKSNGTTWTTVTYSDLSRMSTQETSMATIGNQKGDILVDNNQDLVTLSVGTNNQVLLADSAQTVGIKWGNVDHNQFTDIGTNTHPQIDIHLAATAVHGVTGSIVGTTDVQTLTNKTLTGTTNTIRATQLATTTTDVVISAAAAPLSGQALIATSATTATWQTVTATAAGSTTQVQYNNAGAMGGASKLTIDTDGVAILGEFNTTTPSIPSSGSKIFSRYKGGRRMAAQIGPSGVDYSFQPFLATNKIGWWSATGNGTTISALNLTNTATGTATTRNVATTNLFTSIRRVGFVSVTTAGSSAGTRHGAQQFWMGNAAGLGGFFYVVRFGLSSAATVATQRTFVGLYASTSVIGNVDPSTLLNMVGFGADAADTNLSFMHNDGSGVATKETLTGNIPARSLSADMFEIRIFCAPNGTTIYYSIENLSNPSYCEGSVTTDIPTNTTFLSPQIWTNNGVTALAVGIDVVSQYIETDN